MVRLNIGHGLYIFAGFVFLISIACSRAPQPQTQVATQSPSPSIESYPTLTAQAKQVSEAMERKDYVKVLDMTYPKLIEIAGGRKQALATLTADIKELESEGVSLLSATPGSPTQLIHDSGSIYAVIPMVLKVKAQDGTFKADGALIGISSDGGTNWTFVDAAGKDEKELKAVFANILERLKLPPTKPPVKISS